MRRLIYHLLSSDPDYMLFLPGGLYGDRVEFDQPEVKPFGVLTHEGPLPGVSRMKQARFSLWVHDNQGDYTRIDQALKELESLIASRVPTVFDNVWLTNAEWTGTSPDLYDDVRRTNVKYSTFLLTGSGM